MTFKEATKKIRAMNLKGAVKLGYELWPQGMSTPDYAGCTIYVENHGVFGGLGHTWEQVFEALEKVLAVKRAPKATPEAIGEGMPE